MANETERSNKIQKLEEVTEQILPVTSIAGKLTGIHNQIRLAQNQKPLDLTIEELDRICGKVQIECGIKDQPSEEMVDMCMASWEKNFKAKMNKAEINLAFDMNVNGQLNKKINHFQCFSREYFCEVLNAYIEKKKEVTRYQEFKEEPKEEIKALAFDVTKQQMEDLIYDRKNITKLSIRNTVAAKLELLNQLFIFEVTEKQIKEYRKIAVNEIHIRTAKKKTDARALQKFGVEIECANKVERLKAGTFTDSDDKEIQHEVTKLIYGNALMLWSEFEFIKHVEENMKLL